MAAESSSAGAQHAPIDLRDPLFREDPHAILRQIRESGRVARDVMGVWLVTRHADCSAGLRSSRLSREPWRIPLYRQMRPFFADSTLERTIENWMLFNDPPKHTRLRRLANSAFRPPVIDAMRERIAAVADELLDALPSDEPDLISGFAQPLPVRVICDILGLPPQDFSQTKAWSDALAIVVEPVTRRELRVAADRAAQQMVEYLRAHIARHRAQAIRDDLLGALIAAQDEQGALDEQELLANLVLLFIAGHETTTNLIGNGVLALLRHPDELARLRANPQLLPTAVEEALRYEGSVNMVSRQTIEPYPVGDVVIPGGGETIYFLVGAANRDPEAFAQPDRLDVGRSPNPHLGFGAGIHYCVGAPLARLEGQIALERLLAR
ncbi:MAG TPA: cytochrome P450, partial [Burkholderiaceae bacterium]|nr:cytochrome P450 [Burkholderiaceae bacterium]